MNPRWTALIAAAILPVLGLVDGAFAYFGGNRSTFSWGQLVTRAKDPLIAWAVAYSMGVFLLHCYCPSPAMQMPSPVGIVCRSIVVLSITFAAILYVASGPAADPSFEIDPAITAPLNRFGFALFLLSGVAVGMVAGLFVSQHPFAENS